MSKELQKLQDTLIEMGRNIDMARDDCYRKLKEFQVVNSTASIDVSRDTIQPGFIDRSSLCGVEVVPAKAWQCEYCGRVHPTSDYECCSCGAPRRVI